MKLPCLRSRIFYSLSTILLLSLVLFLPIQIHKVFESPDENANYLATRLYSTTGQLWYQEDYTELDIENYLHPRHFVTYNNRVVPTEFLGLPITYGPLYSIAGDDATIAWGIVLSLISFIFFIRLAALLFGRKASPYAAIIFLANIPLLWYLTMPYFNAAGAITFFIVGVFYLARFYQTTGGKELFLASLFFSLSILFRYDYLIFIGLLFVVVMLNRFKKQWRAYLKPGIVFGSVITAIALIPIFLLNNELYGNALTFGTNLLESQSIGREETGLLQTFLPFPVIPKVILLNAQRLILRLLPLLTLLSIVGVIYVIKTKRFDVYRLLYLVLSVYLVIYSGSSDTWLAYDFSYLGLETSIIRYWLINYLFISIMAVAGISFLHQKYARLVPVVLVVLLVSSTINFLVDNERSVLQLYRAMDYKQETAEIIKAEIDNRSIIYSDSFDKIFNPNGMHAAGWWGREETYNPNQLVESMVRVSLKSDYSVYLYAPSGYVDVKDLNNILKENSMFLDTNAAIKGFYELREMGP